MALGGESEFRAGEQADIRGAHRETGRATDLDVIKFIDLLAIALPNSSVRQVAKAFEGKVSRAAIGHWRTGRYMPPKWIRDKLYALAIERVRQLATLKTNVDKRILGSHNLASYMARRARERDTNKKPG